MCEISSLEKSIIKTLAYYDIFNYPLTLEEIYFCLDTNTVTKDKLSWEIKSLSEKNIIYKKNNYYLLNPDYNSINRRVEGNIRAKKKMKIADRFSKLISFFPFVRAVFLSGSISKGYMDERADIDYFIITKRNRLWIARFLLVLFKRIFLLNSYKYFCINYFVSEDNLEIEEKNIYTATELVTLIPTYGSNLYNDFYKANSWIKTYFPNYPIRNTINVLQSKSKITQKIFEPFLNHRIGEWVDDYCMKMFLKFDKKRYGLLEKESFEVAFKSHKNVSKHHPNYFQKTVLEALKKKIHTLEIQHNIVLN
ncbi:MAG: hypothetical protein JSW63_11095 [Ignavibacterium sp.]|nr:MAG: hypothetical protein JSW63_11095 [Ignavibacterium sp.]